MICLKGLKTKKKNKKIQGLIPKNGKLAGNTNIFKPKKFHSKWVSFSLVINYQENDLLSCKSQPQQTC